MPAADLQWTVIDDFRPGIFQKVTPNTPPGAAVEEDTYQCKSNSNGDLIPGPLLDTNAQIVTDGDLDTTPGGNLYHIVGTQAVSPVLGDTTLKGRDQCNTQLFVAYDWIDTSPVDPAPDDRHRRLDRYKRDSDLLWETIYDAQDTTTQWTADYTPARATFGLTRSNSADPTQSGVSVLVIAQAEELRAFPDDTAPTVTGTVDLPQPVAPNPFPELLIVHQGRVILFPLSLQGFGTDEVWAHNEMMYWLVVNDVTTLDPEITGGFYNIVFGYENPAGYDNGASLSANELFLLKRYGGAIMLQGDLNQPRAVNLPNVMSPGFANSTGVQTPLGYCYVVDNGTLYAWRGGDTSEDLAPMMEPDFWRPITDVTLAAAQDSPNERWRGNTQLALFRDLLLVPNNWYMDLTNAPDPAQGGGGWWRLYNPASPIGDYTPRYSHYTCDWTGRWAWASPYAVEHGASNQVVFDEYDRSRYATDYSWKSVPLSESTDRQMNVREVVLVLSGQGSVVVDAFGRDEDDGLSRHQGTTSEMWVNSEYPIAIRRSLACKGNLIQMRITASQGVEAVPAATLTEDSFDRTDAAALGSTDGPGSLDPQAWTEVAPNDGFTIFSNECAVVQAEATGKAYVTGAVNCEVEAAFTGTVSVNSFGLMIRYQDEDNHYRLAVGTDESVSIQEVAGGIASDLAAGAPADYTTGDTLSIRADGTTLTAYINGVEHLSVVDATYAAGALVGIYDDGGTVSINDFRALTIPVEEGVGAGGAPTVHQLRVGHQARARAGRQNA